MMQAKQPETKEKLPYEIWLRCVISDSKHYPMLKRCNGEFNESMLRDGYAAGLTPMAMCNAMVEVS